MEETEYKSTYQSIAKVRCVFEKALTNNLCQCPLAQHFWLADREGYSCRELEASANCADLLKNLRHNSRFVLKLAEIDDQLPHNMEIRVQAGGLRGLQAVVDASQAEPVGDVHMLVEQLLQRWGSLDALPYDRIVQSVAQYQGRKRRTRK